MSKITFYDDGGAIQAADDFIIARAGENYRVTGDKVITPSGISAQIWLSGRGALAPTTDGFTVGTQVEMTTNKQNFLLPTFPAAVKRYAEWEFAMPSDWDGGTLTATFYWLANSASADNVVWGLQARAYADTDTIDQAYGTAQEVTDANQAAAYKMNITSATASITVAGTPDGNQLIKFRAYRLGSGADSLAVSALLAGIRVDYTRS